MQEQTPDKQRCRILLVDDHPSIRAGLRDLLTFYGDVEIVGEARDGIEAIQLTAVRQPDLIIMDINMPNMNGLEATRRIKRSWPDTVIIGLSVINDLPVLDGILKAGASAYLEKAHAYEDLYPAIQKYCEQRKQAISKKAA